MNIKPLENTGTVQELLQSKKQILTQKIPLFGIIRRIACCYLNELRKVLYSIKKQN